MSCERFRELISHSLDSGEDPSDETRQHLAGCPACRQYRDAMANLEAELHGNLPPMMPVPTELQQRIITAVRSEPRPVARRRLVLTTSGLAAAACLAIAVGFWMAHPPDKPDDPWAGSNEQAAAVVNSVLDELLQPPDRSEQPIARIGRFTTAPIDRELRYLAEDAEHAGRTLLALLPLELPATNGG